MSSSVEKSVKGGTKVKLAPPKSKYVEHILLATSGGEAGVAEIFRTLKERLRDTTWTICFKALIIVHLMIKEGERDATLKYLAAAPKNRLAINSYTDVQTQGQNIRRYNNYLIQRAESFADTHVDHIRNPGRMKNLSIAKGLLRETEAIQDQIRVLIKCDPLENDPENDISLMAFR
ncbi:ANTH-domain-containing protein, partial [Aureobasidium melanogenum]